MRRAAGWATSISWTMVAASLVTNNFSRWLMTSLFMPLGPMEVRVMAASCRHASMLRMIASSRPLYCLYPSFSRLVKPPGAPIRILPAMVLP